jgi:hypothetical protein
LVFCSANGAPDVNRGEYQAADTEDGEDNNARMRVIESRSWQYRGEKCNDAGHQIHVFRPFGGVADSDCQSHAAGVSFQRSLPLSRNRGSVLR